ncbi:hypothetical protein [Methylobacterium marchantiae]|uniref:Uncharacterized protein n=1 Tax=Methylobacterium marchantiae TaxID=600331 RepID=A0ABW3X2T5_9HYPH|nr:hypothetical protein AIGOOFII_1357 [Methylobacterium marchantiae]
MLKTLHRNWDEADVVPGHSCPVEEIDQAYLGTTQGNADLALRCAIADAMSDLLQAEHRVCEKSRLISRGYVRSGVAV